MKGLAGEQTGPQSFETIYLFVFVLSGVGNQCSRAQSEVLGKCKGLYTKKTDFTHTHS